MTKEALKLALEALNDLAAWNDGEVGGHMDEPYSAEVARRTITAIKKALVNEALEKMAENARELGLDYEPEQDLIERERAVGYREGHMAALAQRTWVGLTDEEINSVRYKRDWTGPWTDMTFARAIESKLKEKNT